MEKITVCLRGERGGGHKVVAQEPGAACSMGDSSYHSAKSFRAWSHSGNCGWEI